jgi:hypothetical protein
VRIDVNKPLKKDTKMQDKAGKWCTVKFKYEKLGIFCFVCGVMGHAENKCEVRFSMEQDNGVREWSTEIRADNRRQGGRIASRWLREEGGGPAEVRGGDGARQPQTPGRNTNSGSMPADMAANSSANVHNRPHPFNQEIITQQEKSIAINGMSTHTVTHSPNQEPSNNYPIIPISIPNMPLPPITHENITAPSLNTNTNLSHPFDISNIYSSVTNNQFHPIFLNQPETDNTNPQSLTSQILSFSSQPLTRAPQSNKPPNHKASRAPTHRGVVTRPTSHTNFDPILTQTGPQKKTKKIPTRP